MSRDTKLKARRETTLAAIEAEAGFSERMRGVRCTTGNGDGLRELRQDSERCIRTLIGLLRDTNNKG